MILGYLNVEGLATIGSKLNEAGIDFDPTKYQFGIYGVIIVLMMLFRPDRPDPRAPAQAGARGGDGGHAVLRRHARGRRHGPEPIGMTDLLHAVDVRKEFGGLIAVNDIDFTIPRGRS